MAKCALTHYILYNEDLKYNFYFRYRYLEITNYSFQCFIKLAHYIRMSNDISFYEAKLT